MLHVTQYFAKSLNVTDTLEQGMRKSLLAIRCNYLVQFPRYSASDNGVTWKSGLGVIQGHWKWHHSINRRRVGIGLR